jgi:ubiquinone/menaquinone biosynthesis C-methylase UbiE
MHVERFAFVKNEDNRASGLRLLIAPVCSAQRFPVFLFVVCGLSAKALSLVIRNCERHQGSHMSQAYSYNAGIAGFDRMFGIPMRQFVPSLLTMAELAPGNDVLDVATGTGVAAEAAMSAIGQNGSMTVVDNSPGMLEEARKRLGAFPNVSFHVQDGQALSFADGSFDTVLCSMTLMIFTDPQKAMNGFHRVLRKGGMTAVSVNTAARRSLFGHIRAVIAKHDPSKAEMVAAWEARQFAFGDPDRLRGTFAAAGFQDIQTKRETRTFTFPSFDAYYEPIAAGGGPWGDEIASLPSAIRARVRDDIRSQWETNDGTVRIDVDIGFASGRK